MDGLAIIGALGLFASFALGPWCVRRFLASPHATDPHQLATWSQIHAPAWGAIVALATSIAAGGARPIESGLSGILAPWSVVGAPALASGLILGGLFARGRPVPTERPVWLWPALGALVLLLCVGDRVTFSDGQLLVLGVVALIWWRSVVCDVTTRGNPSRQRAGSRWRWALYASTIPSIAGAALGMPSGTAMTLFVGAGLFGALAALFALLPRTVLWTSGLISLGAIGGLVILRGLTLAIRASREELAGPGLDTLLVVGQVLASSPYVAGFGRVAVEASLLLVLGICVATVGRGGLGPRSQRGVGIALLGMSLGAIAIRFIWL